MEEIWRGGENGASEKRQQGDGDARDCTSITSVSSHNKHVEQNVLFLHFTHEKTETHMFINMSILFE